MGLFTPTGKDLFVKPEDIKNGTVDQFLQGLAKKESSGNYKALGPVINSGMYTGDRAYGKYQIMGKNVPEWSQKYLGKKLTAEQLYQDEKLQDELMKKRAQELYSKYGNWEDVASVHFTGQPLKKAGNVKDQLGTTAPKYVQDVLAFMRGDSPAVQYQSPLTPGMAGSTPVMQDQTVWNTAMQNIGQHPLIQGPLKALDLIGTTIDKGFGLPGKVTGALMTGQWNDNGVPDTFSGQVEEATTGLTGSPTAGAVAGLLGSIAQPMPGPGKVKKVEALADLIKNAKRGDLMDVVNKVTGEVEKGLKFVSDKGDGWAFVRPNQPTAIPYKWDKNKFGIVNVQKVTPLTYKYEVGEKFVDEAGEKYIVHGQRDGRYLLKPDNGIPNEMSFPVDEKVLESNFKPMQGAKAEPFVPGNLSTKILGKLTGRTTVSKQFIEDLVKSGDVKQVERNIILKALDGEGSTVNVANFGKKVEDQLVPLKVKVVGGRDGGVTMSATYSGIRLNDDVRGNVAGYIEKVYQSPVPTSAGNVHFRDKAPNYFGHTRVEDMADKKTRRVIEVQSDLYQKGDAGTSVRKSDDVQEIKSLNAVKELFDYAVKNGMDPKVAFTQVKKAKPNSLVGINSSYEMEQRIKMLQKQAQPEMEKYNSQMEKINQYNNPTAHFRMIREEIAQASKEGKIKVQFPTGETAMKIEGLGGQSGNWIPRTGPNTLTPRNMKVGMEVLQPGSNEYAVIIEVLGDGKFRAVPKHQYQDTYDELLKMGNKPKDIPKLMKMREHIGETFDISGKVDKTNPIYKFYENEVAKYLKNNYKATEVTDKQGVKWMEVTIDPAMQNKPIDAFAMGALPFAPVGYDQMTKAQEDQNGKETIQLNPFQPGFLTSSQTVSKIDPPTQPPAFTEDKKRAFQGNNSMNPDGLSRMGLNPLIPGGSKPDSGTPKPAPATNKPFADQVIKPVNQTYSLRDNKIQTNDEELRQLGAVLFGEMGIRTDKLELEAGIIANTILNRSENRGKSIQEILSQPYQYQAYNDGQYKAYMDGKPQKSKDPVVKAQVEAVNKVLDQIKNGTLENKYGKVENYSHFYRDDSGKELPYGQYPIRVYTDPRLQKIEEWKTYSPKTWAKFSKAERQRIIAKSKAEKLQYLGIKTRQLTSQN